MGIWACMHACGRLSPKKYMKVFSHRNVTLNKRKARDQEIEQCNFVSVHDSADKLTSPRGIISGWNINLYVYVLYLTPLLIEAKVDHLQLN